MSKQYELLLFYCFFFFFGTHLFETGRIITDGATCSGSTLLVADVMDEVEFRWKSGKFEENLPVILHVGYAPYYTTVSVQQFLIPQLHPSLASKSEL